MTKRLSGSGVSYCTDISELEVCAQFMVYLNAVTWRSGKASSAFADEVRKAMDKEMSILLVHEMPGIGGQEARHGCEFGTFFSHLDGATTIGHYRLRPVSQTAEPR